MSPATWRPDEQAWLAANSHGLPPDSPYGNYGYGGYGHLTGPRSPRSTPEPDTPTLEEIARVQNRTWPPLRSFRAKKIARQEKRAELVAAGRLHAKRQDMGDATYIALENIVQIGTGG